jgi:hypothetical protein
MRFDDAGSDTFVLTREELHLLRFSCQLDASEASPLGPLLPMAEPGATERAARSLVARRLAESGSLRPDRELLRRLLVLSQPDARLRLTDAAGEGRPVLEIFLRAGISVEHRRIDDGHELGAPRDLDEVIAEVHRRFAPRGSTGDFVDLSLSPNEYFVFSVVAHDLHVRRQRSEGGAGPLRTSRIRADLPRTEPPTTRHLSFADTSGPGTPLSRPWDDEDERTPAVAMMRRPAELHDGPAVPPEEEWLAALASLEARDLVQRDGDRYTLRPYLHDLAVAIADNRRLVLSRVDFGAAAPIDREVVFIVAPGSVFTLRSAPGAGVRVVELDARGLADAIHHVLDPVGEPGAVSF